MDSTIPVYSPTTRFLYFIPEAAARALPRVLLRFGKHGRIKSVNLKAETAQVRPALTRGGQVVYTQLADGHRCWSMVGPKGKVL